MEMNNKFKRVVVVIKKTKQKLLKRERCHSAEFKWRRGFLLGKGVIKRGRAASRDRSSSREAEGGREREENGRWAGLF